MSAIEVAELAHALFVGYPTYLMALQAARHPASEAVVKAITREGRWTDILSKDRQPVMFDSAMYLQRVQQQEGFQQEYERLWLVGALLTLDDRLKAEGRFDKSPEIEFLRHLRNGVAHGNRFTFQKG